MTTPSPAVGLDTDICPTPDQLSAIWRMGVSWLGYYLAPAPSHQDQSWMGTRAELVAMGFGLCPVFVGQQTQGPGSKLVTANQGTLDGLAAAALMTSEGFLAGSYVFLDIEGGGDLEPKMASYAEAWAAAVSAMGWGVGFYGAHSRAPGLAALWPAARLWCVFTTTLPAPGNPINISPPFCIDATGAVLSPSGSGYPDAFAWQRNLDVTIQADGSPLLVDLSVSLLADPSGS